MKKRIISIMIILVLLFCLGGCGDEIATTVSADDVAEAEVRITYTADFYNNNGGRWISVEGKEFSISPNKIKTCSWDSGGSWISSYEMSSIMSIEIDGYKIESCGSTVVFSDSRLEKCDIEFDSEVITEQVDDSSMDSSISQPSDMRYEDYWKIKYWWLNKSLKNRQHRARLVVIQSQMGNPICMYSGDDVRWDIPSNLPKTTMVSIDDMVIYIHRANFSIIDTELLEER